MNFTTTKKAIEVDSIDDVYCACGDNTILKGMICAGIELGLRYGDMVALKVKDVIGIAAHSVFYIYEQKTGRKAEIVDGAIKFTNLKVRKLVMTSRFREICDLLLTGLNADDFLFAKKAGGIPMSRQNYSKLLKSVCLEAGIPENKIESISTHSCRKSFGVVLRKAGNTVAEISEFYNHSSVLMTRVYCGFDEIEMRDIIKNAFG